MLAPPLGGVSPSRQTLSSLRCPSSGDPVTRVTHTDGGRHQLGPSILQSRPASAHCVHPCPLARFPGPTSVGWRTPFNWAYMSEQYLGSRATKPGRKHGAVVQRGNRVFGKRRKTLSGTVEVVNWPVQEELAATRNGWRKEETGLVQDILRWLLSSCAFSYYSWGSRTRFGERRNLPWKCSERF